MPLGHREKSLRSSPAHSVTLTFVAAASCSREIPRWIRMRRRLGPKASRSLMAAGTFARMLPVEVREKLPQPSAYARLPAVRGFERTPSRAVFQQRDYEFGRLKSAS